MFQLACILAGLIIWGLIGATFLRAIDDEDAKVRMTIYEKLVVIFAWLFIIVAMKAKALSTRFRRIK
jgi:hypothetical protein